MTGSPIPGTAHGRADENFVFLTKQVRIPRSAIVAVRPRRDGDGADVVTERGAMHVCEDYSALVSHIYGVNVNTEGAR